MTRVYDAASLVTVSVAAPTDDAGAVIATTGVEYAIFDEDRNPITTRDTLSGYTSGQETAVITVSGPENTLATGVIHGVRKVEVYFMTADGEYRVTETYLLQSVTPLVLMTNTFQTLEQAMITRLGLGQLLGWDAGTEQQRIGALIAAHDNMCRLAYKYLTDTDLQNLDLTHDISDRFGRPYMHVPSMRLATVQDFTESFPAVFQNALKRAQLVEADNLLNGDPVGDKRRQGIITETIGESKVFLSSRAPLQLPICRAAIDQLSGYLYRSTQLRRS